MEKLTGFIKALYSAHNDCAELDDHLYFDMLKKAISNCNLSKEEQNNILDLSKQMFVAEWLKSAVDDNVTDLEHEEVEAKKTFVYYIENPY